MEKFEKESHYAESSTDSSSEENSMAKIISRIKSSPSLRLTFEKKLSEVSGSSKSMYTLNGTLPDTIKKSRISIVKHVTADSVFEISSDENSPCTTRQSLIRHVTADSETLEKLDKAKISVKKSVNAEFGLDRSLSDSFSICQQSKDITDSKNFKCGFCLSRLDPYCFVCYKAINYKGSSIRQKCSLYQCGRYYHPECLKLWPQTQWSIIQTMKHKTSKEEIDTFVCPQHVCHNCSSDDPRAATSRCSGDKIVKCLKCPSSYHSTNYCIPAGKIRILYNYSIVLTFSISLLYGWLILRGFQGCVKTDQDYSF